MVFITDLVALASEHGISGSPSKKIMQELTVFCNRPRSMGNYWKEWKACDFYEFFEVSRTSKEQRTSSNRRRTDLDPQGQNI